MFIITSTYNVYPFFVAHSQTKKEALAIILGEMKNMMDDYEDNVTMENLFEEYKSFWQIRECNNVDMSKDMWFTYDHNYYFRKQDQENSIWVTNSKEEWETEMKKLGRWNQVAPGYQVMDNYVVVDDFWRPKRTRGSDL